MKCSSQGRSCFFRLTMSGTEQDAVLPFSGPTKYSVEKHSWMSVTISTISPAPVVTAICAIALCSSSSTGATWPGELTSSCAIRTSVPASEKVLRSLCRSCSVDCPVISVLAASSPRENALRFTPDRTKSSVAARISSSVVVGERRLTVSLSSAPRSRMA